MLSRLIGEWFKADMAVTCIFIASYTIVNLLKHVITSKGIKRLAAKMDVFLIVINATTEPKNNIFFARNEYELFYINITVKKDN